MTEFELGGQTYRIDAMAAMKQFHVSRRIAPLLPAILPVYAAFARGIDINQMDQLQPVLDPLCQALSGLTDENSEYVIGACLSVVSRKQEKGWASVWGSAGLMFADIGLNVMMQLTVRVIVDQLGPFLRGMPTAPESIPTKA